MKHFNIDEYTPAYDPSFKLPKQATKADKIAHARAARVHTAGPSYRSGTFDSSLPGADPKKVLDWRSLERRTSQLWARWLEASNKFWDAIRAARAERALDLNQGLYIFVEREWVLQCHDDGFSHQNAVYIADELLKGARKGLFTVMRYEEGGREIGILNRKANFLQKCAGVYERVLERALRDRLQLYLDSIRDVVAHRTYFPPQIYIIENEGRTRAAQSDSLGRLEWLNGDVMCTSKSVGCET